LDVTFSFFKAVEIEVIFQECLVQEVKHGRKDWQKKNQSGMNQHVVKKYPEQFIQVYYFKIINGKQACNQCNYYIEPNLRIMESPFQVNRQEMVRQYKNEQSGQPGNNRKPWYFMPYNIKRKRYQENKRKDIEKMQNRSEKQKSDYPFSFYRKNDELFETDGRQVLHNQPDYKINTKADQNN
jgi:hypothetical protein